MGTTKSRALPKKEVFIHRIRGWYRLNEINKTGARYRCVVGQKSNGKTYAVLEQILRDYVKKGRKAFYIRRWGEDLENKKIGTLFGKGKLYELLKGSEYTFIDYYSGAFYRAFKDEKGKIVREPDPFMYTAALNQSEHFSGTHFPSEQIYTIFFDEFLTRSFYLPNEFQKFEHMVSDIVRDNDIATIYMVGNTVDWGAPYFREMNIFKVEGMQLGEIRVYDHGQGTTIAIEYADGTGLKLKSNVYFAGFDNPALRMITKGSWEIPMYPHLPDEYQKHKTRGNIFIKYGDKVVHGDVFNYKGAFAIYFHDKTTIIRIRDNHDIVLGEDLHEYFPNVEYNIMQPKSRYGLLILKAICDGRVFYQDNFIGEYVNNYLKYCKQLSVIK